MKDEKRKQPDTKYLASVADQFGLGGATDSWCIDTSCEKDATSFLTADDTRLYRSCVGAFCITCWIEPMHSWKETSLDRI